MTAHTQPPPTDPFAPGVRAADVPISHPGPDRIVPNRDDIAAHLYALFSPEFVKAYPNAWIEIAYSNHAGAVNNAKNFSVFDLEKAAEFAEKKNKTGCNVYVGPALRQGERCGRALDKHVVTSSHSWAEYDGAGDDERIAAILKQCDRKPALVITTGTVPHLRRHLYFKIDGVVTPDELRSANTSLKECLDSDDVQNPARIMRLAGTVNYPSKTKREERGYITELVTFHENSRAQSYRVDELTGLIAAKQGKTSSSSDDFDGGRNGPRTDDEIEALLKESQVKQWHNNIRDAIAVMIGRGWNDLQIRLACASYCIGGADDPEMIKLIDDGRKKWDKPDPAPDGKTKADARKRFLFETVADLLSLPVADDLIEGWIPERSVGLLYGKWGSFKTFIAFDWAFHLAYGFKEWHGAKLPGVPCEVLIIAREGHKGFLKRLAAFKARHRLTENPKNLIFMRSPISFLDDAGFAALKEDIKALNRPFRFVVVDTVGRCLPGADMAKEQPITLFMERLQQIGELTDGVSLGVHHENKSGDVNGSMYFQNNSDFMFCTSRDGTNLAGTLTCAKQKDGEDGWSKQFKLGRVILDDCKSSLAIENVSDSEAPSIPKSEKKHRPRSAGTQRVLDCINDAIITNAIDHRVDGKGPVVRAADLKHARDKHRERYVYQGEGDQKEKADAERQAWRAGYEVLRVANKICDAPDGERNLVWVVNNK